MEARDAEQKLSGTFSKDKNEILFKEFGINYNNEADVWKKGSVVFRDVSPLTCNLGIRRGQQKDAWGEG